MSGTAEMPAVPRNTRRRRIFTVSVVTAVAAAALAAGITVIANATGGVSTTHGSSPSGDYTVTRTTSLMSYDVPAAGVREYTVRRGDMLTVISQREYGNPACWPGLYRENRGTIGGNPDIIEAGQRLTVTPSCDARPIASRPASRSFTAAVQRPIAYVTPARHTTPAAPAAPAAPSGSILSYVDEVFGSGASCATEILDHESGTVWSDVTIANPSTGAYGLPQAFPGSKMAAFGSDWATNPLTQLRWMASYVDSSYGGICPAAAHDLSTGTY